MKPIPEPRDDDAEDVADKLAIAAAMWSRGERKDALSWLRRAAEAAAELDQDKRALEIAKSASLLAAGMESSTKETPAPKLNTPAPSEGRSGVASASKQTAEKRRPSQPAPATRRSTEPSSVAPGPKRPSQPAPVAKKMGESPGGSKQATELASTPAARRVEPAAATSARKNAEVAAPLGGRRLAEPPPARRPSEPAPAKRLSAPAPPVDKGADVSSKKRRSVPPRATQRLSTPSTSDLSARDSEPVLHVQDEDLVSGRLETPAPIGVEAALDADSIITLKPGMLPTFVGVRVKVQLRGGLVCVVPEGPGAEGMSALLLPVHVDDDLRAVFLAGSHQSTEPKSG